MPETNCPTVRSLNLHSDLANLAKGRHFVAEVAQEAGFSDDRTFDISVACSEAIANEIEHASVKEPVDVTTLLFEDRLEIQIEGSGVFRAPNRVKGDSHRGLGLPLMAELSDHLALYSGPRGGTLVSLTFYRRSSCC
jgi:serine/threonine-protein kinase RsbW